ncbi:N-acetylmuramidase [Burkholderia phage vB_BpP_HN01]|nr:N-acetylmuramidase [Burkholderia phage vB_BpP_HN01]
MAINLKQKASISAVVAAMVASIFAVEGGYVNNPKDPGGETNHGVTVSVARSAGYIGSMKDLTKEDASNIYVQKYIVDPGFIRFETVSVPIMHKLVDSGVNVGPARPSRWFQESLNSLSRGGKDFPQIQVDGKVGPGTVGAYQALQKKRGKFKACTLTLKLLNAKQTGHYDGLKMSDFTVGWIDNRIDSNIDKACEGDR